MKKSLLNLFLLSFTVISVTAIAQPTITAGGINPTVGQTISGVSSSTQTNPGSAGANQTWNFSTMTGSSASNTVVSPSSTPNGSSFPSATICYNSGSPIYFKTSSTALQYCGAVHSSGAVQSYSDFADYLRFPFTYNNTYTDAFACNYTSSGYPVYRTGTVTVTADGHGTLITPHGTFSNVLRVHLSETLIDSMVVLGTGFVTTMITDRYYWYKENTRASLADVMSVNLQGTMVYVSSYYTGPVGVDENNSFVSNYSIFPNPATDNLSLSFDSKENKNAQIKIFNTAGALVAEYNNEMVMQGNNELKIDVSTLPNGIYFAQLLSEGTIGGTRRFVVSK